MHSLFALPARAVRFALLLGFLAATVSAWPAVAQSSAGKAATSAVDALPDTEIKALVETLQNDTARKKLIGQLNAMIAARHQLDGTAKDHRVGAKFIDVVSQRVSEFGDQLVSGTDVLVDIPGAVSWVRDQFVDSGHRAFWIALVWKVAAVVGAGLVVLWIAQALFGRLRRVVGDRQSSSMLARIPLLVARIVVDLLPLLAFGIAAYGVLPFVHPDKATSLVALSVVNAILAARGIISVARTILAPHAGGQRLFRLSDRNANYLTLWVRRFVNIGVYGYFLGEASLLLGLSSGGYHTIRVVVGALIALLFIVLVLQNRANMEKWIGGPTDSESDPESTSGLAGVGMLRRRLADIWHILAIIYIAALFLVWAVNLKGGFALILQGTVLTVVIVTVAVLLSRAATQLVERGLGIGEEVSRRFPGLEARADRYLAIVYQGMRAIIMLLAVFAVLQAWSIDAFGWLASDMGRGLVGSLMTIVFIVVMAVLVWEIFSSAIERYLHRGAADGAPISSRARTLLPLLRNALMITLTILVILSSLSELGMDIAPLLAAAGILGLAVGFGAQALVKDIITGFFILMEDQIAIGDVVRIGSHGGLVESLTIRTLRLRDVGGNVHIIPFSEVTTVENMTKDFSRYVFDVGVGYREDTDEVVEVLREIGAGMQQDDTFRDLILEPLEILGVDQLADSAVVIKARFTTVPIKQWQVGREFNRRMKKRFDELDIEIPFPHQTVYFGEDKSGQAPAARIRMLSGDPDAATNKSQPARGVTKRSSIDQAIPDSAAEGTEGGDGD
jgi:moderate conductance mechanosensitive channel